MLIKSLCELNLDQSVFPLFYKDEYINYENSIKNEVLIYVDYKIEALIIFKITKLKIISKGQFLHSPCCFKGLELSNIQEENLLNNFFIFLAKNRIIDLILPPIHFSLFKTVPKNCSYYKMGIIQLNNLENEKKVVEKMKPNYRNEIKKLLENKSITICTGDNLLAESYQLIKNTLFDQGLKCESLGFFKTLKENLKNQFYISNCYNNGEAIGSVIFLYDNKSAYYLYSGNKKSNEFPGVNKLLVFKALEFFQEMGIEKVILGGHREEHLASSKIVGIQKFKLRFGAGVENGYHFIKVIKPFKYLIFNFFLRIKSILTSTKLELINLNGFDVKKSK
jgi:lipid II:glycine glycyltransferase (peptidoglycan interpeptide bridge formation enzyme)